MNLANHGYGRYRIGFPRSGVWRVRFNSDWAGYDPGFGGHPCPDVTVSAPGYDSLPFAGEIGLGPYSAVILSQDS